MSEWSMSRGVGGLATRSMGARIPARIQRRRRRGGVAPTCSREPMISGFRGIHDIRDDLTGGRLPNFRPLTDINLFPTSPTIRYFFHVQCAAPVWFQAGWQTKLKTTLSPRYTCCVPDCLSAVHVHRVGAPSFGNFVPSTAIFASSLNYHHEVNG